MTFKPAPMHSSLMGVSIIGFLLSVFFVWNRSETWGATFTIVFALMFIATLIAMTKGTLVE